MRKKQQAGRIANEDGHFGDLEGENVVHRFMPKVALQRLRCECEYPITATTRAHLTLKLSLS